MHGRLAKGFKLLEMVITLTMLSAMAALSAPYLSNGVRAFNESASAVHTLSKLRIASERLVREIREVGLDAGNNYNITSMTSSQLVFTKTDGVEVSIDIAAPVITLAYDSVAATPTLTDEVNASSALSYLQSDGSTTAFTNADVKFIEFELILTHSGNNYAQRGRIALRNQP